MGRPNDENSSVSADGAGTDTNYGETLVGSLLYLFDNGNDDPDGQKGNDALVDHNGTDTMSGGLGSDTIDVQDGAGGDATTAFPPGVTAGGAGNPSNDQSPPVGGFTSE